MIDLGTASWIALRTIKNGLTSPFISCIGSPFCAACVASSAFVAGVLPCLGDVILLDGADVGCTNWLLCGSFWASKMMSSSSPKEEICVHNVQKTSTERHN
uniref:Uncharacterized protein n=1 Tax=Romanomermis culicivorax TaxID=13658 RepID=A0A915K110_ROMCU